MTNELLDKLMKPYWELKFNSTELGYFNEYKDPWFGFVLNNEILVGCPVEDLSSGSWFYAGLDFVGGEDMFDVTRKEFLSAMVRYLNKTYNVEIKSIM